MTNVPTMEAAYRHFVPSGSGCSFPGSGRPIVDPATGDLTGAIPPRYDPMQTDELRQGVGNLVLVCSDRHAEIDQIDRYSADFPVGVNAANEGHIQRGKEPREEVATALLTTKLGNRITQGSAIVSERQSGGQVAHTIMNVGPNASGESAP